MKPLYLIGISTIIWLITYIGWKKILRAYKNKDFLIWEILTDGVFITASSLNLAMAGWLFTIVANAHMESELTTSVSFWTILFVASIIIIPFVVSTIRNRLYKKITGETSSFFIWISYLHSLLWGIASYIIASHLL